MKNGKVLDVEVMRHVCKGCTLNEELRLKDPEAYDIWKSAHICKLHHALITTPQLIFIIR